MKKLALIVSCLMGLYLTGCTVYDPQTGRSVSFAPAVYEGAPYPAYSSVPYYYYGGVSYYYVDGRYCYYRGSRPVYITVLPNGGSYNHGHPYYSQRNNPNFQSSHSYRQNNYQQSTQYQKPSAQGQPTRGSYQGYRAQGQPTRGSYQGSSAQGQPTRGNNVRGGQPTKEAGRPATKDQKKNPNDKPAQ